MPELPLTLRQEQFCYAYMATDGNGAQAAELAGYSPRSRRVIASQLKQHPRVQKRIQQLQSERAQQIEAKAQFVLREYFDLVRKSQDAGDYETSLKALLKFSEETKVFNRLFSQELCEMLAEEEINWPLFLNKLIQVLLIQGRHQEMLQALELRLRFRVEEVSATECRTLLKSIQLT